VSGQDQCQVARRAGGGQIADFGFAARAQVATTRQLAVAGTDRGFLFGYAGGEAHH